MCNDTLRKIISCDLILIDHPAQLLCQSHMPGNDSFDHSLFCQMVKAEILFKDSSVSAARSKQERQFFWMPLLLIAFSQGLCYFFSEPESESKSVERYRVAVFDLFYCLFCTA